MDFNSDILVMEIFLDFLVCYIRPLVRDSGTNEWNLVFREIFSVLWSVASYWTRDQDYGINYHYIHQIMLIGCFSSSSFYSPPLPSDLSGPNQYVDYVGSPTSPESIAESSVTSSSPIKLTEDLDGRWGSLFIVYWLIDRLI